MAPRIRNWIAPVAEREFTDLLKWLDSDGYDGKGARKDRCTYHQDLVTIHLNETKDIQIINFNLPRKHPFDVTVSDGSTQLRATFDKEATRAFEKLHGHKFIVYLHLLLSKLTSIKNYHPTECTPKRLILKVSKFCLIKGTAGAGTIGRPSGVENHKTLMLLLARIDDALSRIQSQVSYQPEMSSPIRFQSSRFSEPNSPIPSSHATLATFATQIPSPIRGRISILPAKVEGKDHQTEKNTASLIALIAGHKRKHSNESNDQVTTPNTRIVQGNPLELSPASISQPVSRKGAGTLSRIETNSNGLQPQIISQSSFLEDHAVDRGPGTSANINDDEKENSQESLGDTKGTQKLSKQRYLIREDVPELSSVGRVPSRYPFQGMSRVPRRYVQIPKDQQILLDRSDSWAQPTLIGSRTSYANIPRNIVKDLSSFNDGNSVQTVRVIEASEIYDAGTAQPVSLEDEQQSQPNSSNESDDKIKARNEEFYDSNSGEGEVAEQEFSERPIRFASTGTASFEDETHSGIAEDDKSSTEMKTGFYETVDHAVEEAVEKSDRNSINPLPTSPRHNITIIEQVSENPHLDLDEFSNILDDLNRSTRDPSLLHETTQSPLATGEPLSSFHMAKSILSFSSPVGEEEEEEEDDDEWELAVPHAIHDRILDAEITEVPRSSDQHLLTPPPALPMVQVEQTPFPKHHSIEAVKNYRGGNGSVAQLSKSSKRLHDEISSDPIMPGTYDVNSQGTQLNVDQSQLTISNGKPPTENFRAKDMQPNLQGNNEYEVTPKLGMQVVIKTSHPHSSNVSKISETVIFGTDTSELPDQVAVCDPPEVASTALENQSVDSTLYFPDIPSQTSICKIMTQDILEIPVHSQLKFSQEERALIDTKEAGFVMDDLSPTSTQCSPSFTRRSSFSVPRSPEQSASLYQKYKEAYPTYNGSPRDFVRVLVYVEYLSSINKLVHPFLWDDFIRAFSTEFESYVKRVRESGEEPVTYFVYYNRNVVPTFNKFIITEDNLKDYLTQNPEEAMKARLLFRKPQPLTTTATTTGKSQEANSPLDNTLNQFLGGTQILPPEGRYFETYSQVNATKELNTTATSLDPSPKTSGKTPRHLPWKSPPSAREHIDSNGRSSPLMAGRSIGLSRSFEGSFSKAHLRRSLEAPPQAPSSKRARYSDPTDIRVELFASSQDTRSLATGSKSGVRKAASMSFGGDNKVERLPDEQQRKSKLTSLKTQRKQFHAFAEKRGRWISSHGRTPELNNAKIRFCTKPLRGGLRDQEDPETQNSQC
ncbi:hypothetical protein B7494_g501 [Chlorociboria aeruginascens]|nr:hypothetical protein B7494_g501 [Chlorociboria aeruginascens]